MFAEFFQLFFTFFKVGLFTFGGGYGMIPVITDEVLSHGWMTETEILNFIAVSESTPGPIAVNMATFIGSSQGTALWGTPLGGLLGAVVATLGVVLQSFIIILIIAAAIGKLMKFAGVQAFLCGIRPVVSGLIVATGAMLVLTVITGLEKVGDTMAFDWRAAVTFSVVAAVSLIYKRIAKKSLSVIILILVSAVIGMLLYGVLG